MGETNSPSVANVGYDISPLSKVEFKILTTRLMAWVEQYSNSRETEGESIYTPVKFSNLSDTIKHLYTWYFIFNTNFHQMHL